MRFPKRCGTFAFEACSQTCTVTALLGSEACSGDETGSKRDQSTRQRGGGQPSGFRSLCPKAAPSLENQDVKSYH